MALAAAVVATHLRRPAPEAEKALLFPELRARANDISEIRVLGHDRSVTLARTGDAWTIREADGYPALNERVRDTVMGVAIALRLDDTLQRTIDLLHSEFVIKNVAVRLELASDLPLILGNEVELQQVFLNLITNAFDAMADRERGARQILISTASDVPQTIRLSVRDSGTGLSEEQLGRIFEPFYTTKTSGMGMGLAICRSIIEAHGGAIWVESPGYDEEKFPLDFPYSSAITQRPARLAHGQPAISIDFNFPI